MAIANPGHDSTQHDPRTIRSPQDPDRRPPNPWVEASVIHLLSALRSHDDRRASAALSALFDEGVTSDDVAVWCQGSIALEDIERLTEHAPGA